MIKLLDICEIRNGITLRNTLDTKASGEIAILQPKDIQHELLETPTIFIKASEINNVERHLLKPSDILIVNKGVKFGTFLFGDGYPPSIASGSFFVISCNSKKCLPEYLEWFLQQPSTKKFLLNNSSTTTVASLSKAVLEQLDVVLPSLKIQQQAVSIITLAKQKHLLLMDLIEKNEEFKNNFIWEKINRKVE